MKRLITFCGVGIMICCTACAEKMPLPPPQHVLVGRIVSHQVRAHETMNGIARRYHLGVFALIEANPRIKPNQLKIGTVLIIPKQFILPANVLRSGIVINLNTFRLFYFPKNQNVFYVYPIGIGRVNWQTPLGVLSVVQKEDHPVWHVPNSIFKYRKSLGIPVSHTVAPGPNNPLGEFALRLSEPHYLIHGTNDPASVGVRSSAGCVHLYPEDIRELFQNVPVGTRVVIINEPYQIGWEQDTLYLESHLPLLEERPQHLDSNKNVFELMNNLSEIPVVRWKAVQKILSEHTGIPTPIPTIKKRSVAHPTDDLIHTQDLWLSP